jgi:hypothetical protein
MADKPVLFDTGFIVRTPGAMTALIEAQVTESRLIERHQSGDFGELCDEDVAHNWDAVRHGGRVLSSYPVDAHTKVWVITEADRSVTTLLLPSEY